MFARVTLDLGATRSAVLIPRDGLVYRGTQPGVFVAERGNSAFKAIETGQTRGADVEVLANLDAGTKIVTRGSAMLREGDELKVIRDSGGERDARPEKSAGTKQAKHENGGAE